ncbi:MAG: DUF2948 family protein [Alphaproteobacteria bacterium]
MPLRLRAEDEEDLAVISACLQDALVTLRDIAYDPGAQAFMLVVNRFRWEDCPGSGGSAPFERILCGVMFDRVTAVSYRGFNRGEKDRILALLAIRPAPDAPPGGPGHPGETRSGMVIDLEFAGDAQIRLTAASLRIRARDFGDPWPTPWQPLHALDETA